MKYRIAIVEDEKEFREQLRTYLKQYADENKVDFRKRVTIFATVMIGFYAASLWQLLIEV